MARASSLLASELARFGARRLPRWSAIVASALAVSAVVITLIQGEEIAFWSALPATLDWVGQLLVFLSVALGASAVAAEWNTGSLAALLVFDPNRVRVLLGKAVAAAVGCAAAAAVVLAVVGLSVSSGAAVSGAFEREDAPPPDGRPLGENEPGAEVRLIDDEAESTVGGVASLGGRTIGASALAGAFGLAAGALVRRTAGVIAGFLILFMVGEWAIGELFRIQHFWGPARSLVAIAVGPVDFFSVQEPSGPYLLAGFAWTIGALVIASLWFRRVEVATGPR